MRVGDINLDCRFPCVPMRLPAGRDGVGVPSGRDCPTGARRSLHARVVAVDAWLAPAAADYGRRGHLSDAALPVAGGQHSGSATVPAGAPGERSYGAREVDVKVASGKRVVTRRQDLRKDEVVLLGVRFDRLPLEAALSTMEDAFGARQAIKVYIV